MALVYRLGEDSAVWSSPLSKNRDTRVVVVMVVDPRYDPWQLLGRVVIFPLSYPRLWMFKSSSQHNKLHAVI